MLVACFLTFQAAEPGHSKHFQVIILPRHCWQVSDFLTLRFLRSEVGLSL